MHLFETMPPLSAALVCTLFTWGMTALGAAVVFLFKTCKAAVMHMMIGCGSGIMIAACFWSLLTPALEMSGAAGQTAWLVPAVGLALGCGFILLADRLLDRVCRCGPGCGDQMCKRSVLLVVAVTLHNIPEGMVVGVAFGSAALGVTGTSVWGAVILAIGIGLQNFPEGAAISLPLRSDGMSRSRSFFYGQMSGVVEPVAALLGVSAVSYMQSAVPFLMSFSAGAMIAVVVGELIPESANQSKYSSIVGFVLGFIVMMILDVSLG